MANNIDKLRQIRLCLKRKRANLRLRVTSVREVDPSMVLEKSNFLFWVLSSELGRMVNQALVVVDVTLFDPVVIEEEIVLVRKHFQNVLHR